MSSTLLSAQYSDEGRDNKFYKGAAVFISPMIFFSFFSAFLNIYDDIDLLESQSDSQSTSESCDTHPEMPPPAKQPSLVSARCDDVASFIGTKVSSGDRYQLLTKHFKPGHNYIFPKSSSGHSFQHKWLQQYPWLVYSKQENGVFFLSPLCCLLN